MGQSEWDGTGVQTGVATSTGALQVPDARALTLSAALVQADKLLYAAKAGGKQRLSFATATATATAQVAG